MTPASPSRHWCRAERFNPDLAGRPQLIKGDCERIKARGAEFTMPPTDVTGSTIAMLKDTCGNLIQLTQLKRW